MLAPSLPSSMKSRSPGRTMPSTPPSVHSTAARTPSGATAPIPPGAVTTSRSPSATRCAPATRTSPVRIFGPPRSMITFMRRPVAASAARTCAIMRCQASRPSWAQLIRTASTPRSASFRMKAGSSAASLGQVTSRCTGRCGEAGPSTARVRSASRRSPSKKAAGDTSGSSGGRPASAARARSTLSSTGSTRLSSRPSEDRPSSISGRCKGRKSRCRNAR